MHIGGIYKNPSLFSFTDFTLGDGSPTSARQSRRRHLSAAPYQETPSTRLVDFSNGR